MFRSSLIRAFILSAALLSGLQPLRPASAQEVLDGIAAVVNDDVITYSQMRELVGAKEKSVRESLKGNELLEKIKEIRMQAVNDLIDRQLIIQEFKRNKFQIPTHYIDDRIETITREEFGGDRSAFSRTLAAQGYSLERYRQIETDRMIVQAMRGQALKGDVVIPAAKIAAYREAHIADYTTQEQIKVRMITLRKGGSDSARKMIDELRQKIVAGANFQELARTYSEDSNKESGGDWGWVNRTTLNENLTKAAFNLKPGKVSEVIEFANSYYLILVEAKTSTTSKPLEEVRDEIEKKLIQEERQKRQLEWTAKLRKKAYVKIL